MAQNRDVKPREKIDVPKKPEKSAGFKSVVNPTLRDTTREPANTSALEGLGNIEQIRNIILGPQTREYNRRFEKIESELSAFQEEINYRLDEAKDTLSRELRNAVDALDRRIKSLNAVGKEEWSELREHLDSADEKFSNSLQQFRLEVETNTKSLREELYQARGKVQEDLLSLKTHIYEELHKQLVNLEDHNVAREQMAEILFELGMRIKGVEFVSDLKYSPIV
jgi:hypothetical protein